MKSVKNSLQLIKLPTFVGWNADAHNFKTGRKTRASYLRQPVELSITLIAFVKNLIIKFYNVEAVIKNQEQMLMLILFHPFYIASVGVASNLRVEGGATPK